MQNDTRIKLLFFSCEPGGAEVLIPLIKRLESEKDFDVVTLGYSHALQRFASKEVHCQEVSPVSATDAPLLDMIRPDWVVTSATSLPERDMSEKYLWHHAQQRNIPSLAFLDQWQNYVPRFSGPGAQERLTYLPDYINCINVTGRDEMIAAGFPPERLLTWGHPYLSSLRNLASSINVEAVRRRLRCGDARLALFVSEPIREHYGASRGYDQYGALELFLKMLQQRAGELRPAIKLHPKDDVAHFEGILERYRHLDVLLMPPDINAQEAIMASDYVFGMTSIMLIEGYVLGKPVISLQPGLIGEDPFILSRLGLVKCITTTDDISFVEEGLVPAQTDSFGYDFDMPECMRFLRAQR